MVVWILFVILNPTMRFEHLDSALLSNSHTARIVIVGVFSRQAIVASFEFTFLN